MILFFGESPKVPPFLQRRAVICKFVDANPMCEDAKLADGQAKDKPSFVSV